MSINENRSNRDPEDSIRNLQAKKDKNSRKASSRAFNANRRTNPDFLKKLKDSRFERNIKAKDLDSKIIKKRVALSNSGMKEDVLDERNRSTGLKRFFFNRKERKADKSHGYQSSKSGHYAGKSLERYTKRLSTRRSANEETIEEGSGGLKRHTRKFNSMLKKTPDDKQPDYDAMRTPRDAHKQKSSYDRERKNLTQHQRIKKDYKMYGTLDKSSRTPKKNRDLTKEAVMPIQQDAKIQRRKLEKELAVMKGRSLLLKSQGRNSRVFDGRVREIKSKLGVR